jgi:hypothetical protein
MGMITDEQRSNMAANLVDFLVELEAKAERDSDPISMEGLTDEGVAVGAVVLIRGSDVFNAFAAWAAELGYYTPGKGIVDGTETTDEVRRGPSRQVRRVEVFEIKGPDEWPGLIRAAGLSREAYLEYGEYGKIEIGIHPDATIFGRLLRADGGDDDLVVPEDDEEDEEDDEE